MASDSRTGFTSLALGSGSDLAARGIIVSPEALSSEERAQVEYYVTQCRDPNRSSILVGVMRGHAAWDLRPLLLETAPSRGALTLIRLSDPTLPSANERYAGLEAMYAALSSPQGLGVRNQLKVLSCGQIDSQFWISRRFFKRMLSDPGEGAENLVSPPQFCQRLIAITSAAQQRGIIHGHISPENIAIDESGPVIVDFGFVSSLAPHDRPLGATIAPELSRQALPDDKSEVFALGVLIARLLGNSLSHDQRAIVERMQSNSPADRPTLRAVEQSLFPSSRVIASSTPSASSSHSTAPKVVGNTSSGTVRTGKVLGGEINTQPSKGDRQVKRPETTAASARKTSVSLPDLKRLKKFKRPASFAALALIVLLLFVKVILPWFGSDAEREAHYQELWSSGDKQKIEQVARDAVINDDESATTVVLKDAVSEKPSAFIRANLLKTAFHRKWEQDLSENDRKIALRLGLASVLTDPSIVLPPLPAAHPGVLLAVVGDLSLSLSEGKFGDISIEKMASLPEPYGLAFSELQKTGVKALSDLSARALCHILIGDGTPEVVQAYFAPAKADQEFLSRLLVIVPFAEMHPNIVAPIFSVVRRRGNVLSRRLDWFSADTSAQWETVPDAARLLLLVGMFPDAELSFEQFTDLLSFPAARVREDAVTHLLKEFSDQKIEDTLKVLASDQSSLSRSQIILLTATLRLKDKEPSSEATASLIARWFKTSPDAQSVLALLAARKNTERNDPFNVDAARYLSGKDWAASLEQLKNLTLHAEPLARALAYSRLDASIENEAALLREAVKHEQVQRMRDEVIRKLKKPEPVQAPAIDHNADEDFGTADGLPEPADDGLTDPL